MNDCPPDNSELYLDKADTKYLCQFDFGLCLFGSFFNRVKKKDNDWKSVRREKVSTEKTRLT